MKNKLKEQLDWALQEQRLPPQVAQRLMDAAGGESRIKPRKRRSRPALVVTVCLLVALLSFTGLATVVPQVSEAMERALGGFAQIFVAGEDVADHDGVRVEMLGGYRDSINSQVYLSVTGDGGRVFQQACVFGRANMGYEWGNGSGSMSMELISFDQETGTTLFSMNADSFAGLHSPVVRVDLWNLMEGNRESVIEIPLDAKPQLPLSLADCGLASLTGWEYSQGKLRLQVQMALAENRGAAPTFYLVNSQTGEEKKFQVLPEPLGPGEPYPFAIDLTPEQGASGQWKLVSKMECCESFIPGQWTLRFTTQAQPEKSYQIEAKYKDVVLENVSISSIGVALKGLYDQSAYSMADNSPVGDGNTPPMALLLVDGTRLELQPSGGNASGGGEPGSWGKVRYRYQIPQLINLGDVEALLLDGQEIALKP